MSPEDFGPVDMRPSSTSYFSEPEPELDPSLFDGMHLRPHVREWILSNVLGWLAENFIRPESWSRMWIAGSGVSYQWSADRQPADLDIMLGIDYPEFRRSNPDLSGLSDSEVASYLNQEMHDDLYPDIDGVAFGRSTFEVTVYANLGVNASRDGIKFIHPYAAYDLTQDEWAVLPDKNPVNVHPAWEMSAESDRARGARIVDMYNDYIAQIRGATNPAHRTNAEQSLRHVLDAAVGLFDEIHAGRKAAFSPQGSGYADFHNYRWQAGKRTGVVQAMKRLKEYVRADRKRTDFETYGMELPDTETIIRRSLNSFWNRRG